MSVLKKSTLSLLCACFLMIGCVSYGSPQEKGSMKLFRQVGHCFTKGLNGLYHLLKTVRKQHNEHYDKVYEPFLKNLVNRLTQQ